MLKLVNQYVKHQQNYQLKIKQIDDYAEFQLFVENMNVSGQCGLYVGKLELIKAKSKNLILRTNQQRFIRLINKYFNDKNKHIINLNKLCIELVFDQTSSKGKLKKQIKLIPKAISDRQSIKNIYQNDKKWWHIMKNKQKQQNRKKQQNVRKQLQNKKKQQKNQNRKQQKSKKQQNINKSKSQNKSKSKIAGQVKSNSKNKEIKQKQKQKQNKQVKQKKQVKHSFNLLKNDDDSSVQILGRPIKKVKLFSNIEQMKLKQKQSKQTNINDQDQILIENTQFMKQSIENLNMNNNKNIQQNKSINRNNIPNINNFNSIINQNSIISIQFKKEPNVNCTKNIQKNQQISNTIKYINQLYDTIYLQKQKQKQMRIEKQKQRQKQFQRQIQLQIQMEQQQKRKKQEQQKQKLKPIDPRIKIKLVSKILSQIDQRLSQLSQLQQGQISQQMIILPSNISQNTKISEQSKNNIQDHPKPIQQNNQMIPQNNQTISITSSQVKQTMEVIPTQEQDKQQKRQVNQSKEKINKNKKKKISKPQEIIQISDTQLQISKIWKINQYIKNFSQYKNYVLYNNNNFWSHIGINYPLTPQSSSQSESSFKIQVTSSKNNNISIGVTSIQGLYTSCEQYKNKKGQNMKNFYWVDHNLLKYTAAKFRNGDQVKVTINWQEQNIKWEVNNYPIMIQQIKNYNGQVFYPCLEMCDKDDMLLWVR